MERCEEVATETTAITGGDCTVYRGDCLEIMRDRVPDGQVSLIFADPPYNIGKSFGKFRDKWPSDEDYAQWCYTWLEICLRKLTENGSMYVMTSTQAMPLLDLWLRRRCTVLSRIVWHYDSSGVQARKFFGSMYEPILYCVKDPKSYTFNADDIEVEARTGAVRKLVDYRKQVPALYNSSKVPGNVWYFPRVRYRMDEYEDHPSQKPESLLRRIIQASSNVGDLVLDPFAGTFTTCAVSQSLGRRSVGIELDREYFKAGVRRLGLATALDGEELRPLKKEHVRKNGTTAKAPNGSHRGGAATKGFRVQGSGPHHDVCSEILNPES
jgi:adenine-specific DNA-methyltransferase